MDDYDTQSPQHEGIRINKYLASCGYESRRKADQLIAEGAVEINGKRVETPGVRVMPGDYVKVNGHHALPKEEVSLLLNKPRGFVCSREAQGAEGTVYDLLPPKYRYVNYVGRLDTDSEGLLILTNKGTLSQHLGHPNNGVEKEYWVTLDQQYDNSVLLQLLKGVRIPEGQAKAKYISRLSPRRACVVLEQGLKRQIRQMFSCLGFRVRKLVRVRIGSLWGGDLMPGRAMLLTPEQEKLAGINPPPRKGFISAAQAFPGNKNSLSDEQLARALDEKAARAALEEETDYKFNPADFESDDDVADTPFRSWDDDEPQQGRGFRAPRREGARGGFGRRESRDFGRDGSRSFRSERSEGYRGRSSFGRERSGASFRTSREGGERRGFGGRSREDRAPRSFRDESESRSFGAKSFAPRRKSWEHEDSERRPAAGERRFRRDFSDAAPRSRSFRSEGGEGGRDFRKPRPRRGSFGGARSGGHGAQRRSGGFGARSFKRGPRH